MLEPIVQIWEDFYNLIVGGLSTGTELKLNNCNIFWTILVTTFTYMEFQLLNMISVMWIHMEIFSLMFETERKVKLDHQRCQYVNIYYIKPKYLLCFKDYDNIGFCLLL